MLLKKKTFIFFSHFLSRRTLSCFLILYLSVSQCRGARHHRRHWPPPTTSRPASKKKTFRKILWIDPLNPKLTRPDSRSPSSITPIPYGWSLSPFPQPERRDRSVRQWVLRESPKGHDGPSSLQNRRRRYPLILLRQSPLHHRKLPHVSHRGRENA